MLHTIMSKESQDVTRSPFAQAEFGHCRSAQVELWERSAWEKVSMLHPEIFVRELCVTCHAVTVTIYDLHHLNRLSCYHLLKVTCLFGSDPL